MIRLWYYSKNLEYKHLPHSHTSHFELSECKSKTRMFAIFVRNWQSLHLCQFHFYFALLTFFFISEEFTGEFSFHLRLGLPQQWKWLEQGGWNLNRSIKKKCKICQIKDYNSFL